MAEAVFSHLIEKNGVLDDWEVDSAGIGGWHAGNSPDPRATSVLNKYQINYKGRARQVQYFQLKIALSFFNDCLF